MEGDDLVPDEVLSRGEIVGKGMVVKPSVHFGLQREMKRMWRGMRGD